MAFPANLDDSSSLPNPSGTNKQNNPDHGSLHTLENQAIIGLETKLGTGASTPVANRILFGTGTGTSAWTQMTSAQLAASMADETGSGTLVFANTPTLITPKVDVINEATLNNGVTIDGVLLKDSKMNGSYISDGTLTSAALGTGMVVQTVSSNLTANTSGSSIIPWDNTIPQNTEGTEILTQIITPKSASNRLSIEVKTWMSATVITHHIMTLFQDSIANATAATAFYQGTAGGATPLTLTYDMVAGTTSPITFRARVGIEVAGTYTIATGSGTGAKFGGIVNSNIKVTEYKA